MIEELERYWNVTGKALDLLRRITTAGYSVSVLRNDEQPGLGLPAAVLMVASGKDFVEVVRVNLPAEDADDRCAVLLADRLGLA